MVETYPVIKKIADSAYINSELYDQMYKDSITNPEEFWSKLAKDFLDWIEPFDTVLKYDYSKAEVAWFLNGKLNVSSNCLDRNLASRANKTAIIWEGNEPGETRKLTYKELHQSVCKFANVLKKHGIKKGDRVAIYLPMVPELAMAMLACARIGAIHSVIFAGFSAAAIKGRVLDAECKLLITANEGLRGNKKIPLKEIVDTGIHNVECVKSVLLVKRTETPVNFIEGRDYWLDQELEAVDQDCSPEIMDSEDPLFVLYTSGSTGKPKGVLHTSAGYLLYACVTHKYVFDYHEDDIYFCAADIGWITGHSYIVYGPLANGATTIMFESIPTYPDAGRYWDIVERHKVNIFYTAPTAIRAIAKEGDAYVEKYDLSSLRVLGSVGEPINEDAWKWYYSVVGQNRCALVDTWWQTETGGIMLTPLPGATATKPGSATKPFFGVQPCIVDASGQEMQGSSVKGRLCIKFPWPGQMRTVLGDHQRFFDTYFKEVPMMYFTGDAAYRDEDNYYWITGRVDDVLNVSGHRIGTAEIESAIVHSGVVVEAAVVGMPHDIKGTGIYAFCILRSEYQPDENAKKSILMAVRNGIGAFANPDIVHFVPGLPKTRSGKIMRRILRKIAAGDTENLGDLTTLADQSVVQQIIESGV